MIWVLFLTISGFNVSQDPYSAPITIVRKFITNQECVKELSYYKKQGYVGACVETKGDFHGN